MSKRLRAPSLDATDSTPVQKKTRSADSNSGNTQEVLDLTHSPPPEHYHSASPAPAQVAVEPPQKSKGERLGESAAPNTRQLHGLTLIPEEYITGQITAVYGFYNQPELKLVEWRGLRREAPVFVCS